MNRRREFQERERNFNEKVRYAVMMEFTVSGDYTPLWNVYAQLDENRRDLESVDYTEIVFVHSSEEAIQFDEHISVVWPSRVPPESTAPVRGTESKLGDVQWAWVL